MGFYRGSKSRSVAAKVSGHRRSQKAKVKVHQERASEGVSYLPTRLFWGHLDRSQDCRNPWRTYKTLPRLTTRRKSGLLQFNSQSQGFFGDSGCRLGPGVLVGQNQLLPDAVTQQPTGSQGAGACGAPFRCVKEAGLGARGPACPARTRPFRNNASGGCAPLAQRVGRTKALRHRLLMNNAGSGRCPGPGSGVAESPQWLSC